MEETPQRPLGEILRENLRELILDVIVPTRVIVASFLVFVVFLLADEAILLIIKWLIRDLASRNQMIGTLLEGIEIFSFLGVAVYFVISTIASLRLQWQVTKRIEEALEE